MISVSFLCIRSFLCFFYCNTVIVYIVQYLLICNNCSSNHTDAVNSNPMSTSTFQRRSMQVYHISTDSTCNRNATYLSGVWEERKTRKWLTKRAGKGTTSIIRRFLLPLFWVFFRRLFDGHVLSVDDFHVREDRLRERWGSWRRSKFVEIALSLSQKVKRRFKLKKPLCCRLVLVCTVCHCHDRWSQFGDKCINWELDPTPSNEMLSFAVMPSTWCTVIFCFFFEWVHCTFLRRSIKRRLVGHLTHFRGYHLSVAPVESDFDVETWQIYSARRWASLVVWWT